MIRDIAALLRLACLWFQAYSLAITIDGRATCFDFVTDPLTRAGMNTAQALAINELRRVRREMAEIVDSLSHFWRAA